jgi:hypothetical protein
MTLRNLPMDLADARLVTVAEREGGQACGEVSVESEVEHDEQLVHLRAFAKRVPC